MNKTMDDILKTIKERRSVREFQKKEIPEEIIDKLIEALIWAPSAGNLQSRKFHFVFNQEIKEKLAKAAFGQDFIAKAPLVVIGCTDDKISRHYRERGRNLYSICDVAASIENMMLLSTELGLGTCWVGTFDENEVSKILNLPSPSTRAKLGAGLVPHRNKVSGAGNLRPIAIIPVGYLAENPLAPPRVSKSEAIKFLK